MSDSPGGGQTVVEGVPVCAAIRASEDPLAGDGGEDLLRGVWVEEHRRHRPEG